MIERYAYWCAPRQYRFIFVLEKKDETRIMVSVFSNHPDKAKTEIRKKHPDKKVIEIK